MYYVGNVYGTAQIFQESILLVIYTVLLRYNFTLMRASHVSASKIYVSDQVKSFESREFTRKLTQPCEHLFLFK